MLDHNTEQGRWKYCIR